MIRNEGFVGTEDFPVTTLHTAGAERDFTPDLSSCPFLGFQFENSSDRLDAELHTLKTERIRRGKVRFADAWATIAYG
jgi:hypothetical protein